MVNKSHFNSGHIAMNRLNRNGILHSSTIKGIVTPYTVHGIFIQDAVDFLKKLPDSSVQLIIIDPPYNLNLDKWDSFHNYLDWAKGWLDQIYRVLSDSGNCVIFGGFQYQDLRQGDLLEILHYIRHATPLRFVNLIIWYYKNGMSAHRFFANRHEEIVWLSKTKKYYFDLDSVREPFNDATKEMYKKDKRLNPKSIDKGKNPTNVWEIGRLNGNSKERVGHLTQKPVELIKRFVKALSFEGSVVLDPFAGSGTTGHVCIEERRHSLLVDTDNKLYDYLDKHIKQIESNPFPHKYRLMKDKGIDTVLKEIALVNKQLPQNFISKEHYDE
jgi:site-specific DNA-methyltransferase (adenine-specific)